MTDCSLYTKAHHDNLYVPQSEELKCLQAHQEASVYSIAGYDALHCQKWYYVTCHTCCIYAHGSMKCSGVSDGAHLFLTEYIYIYYIYTKSCIIYASGKALPRTTVVASFCTVVFHENILLLTSSAWSPPSDAGLSWSHACIHVCIYDFITVEVSLLQFSAVMQYHCSERIISSIEIEYNTHSK